MIAVARTADVVIMMLDATKGEVQRSAGLGRGAGGRSGKAWSSRGRSEQCWPCSGGGTVHRLNPQHPVWCVLPEGLHPA